MCRGSIGICLRRVGLALGLARGILHERALGRVVDLCPPVFRLEPLVEKVGSLEPVPTPGHTPGHVCLFHREDGALLSGDALIVEDGRASLPAENLSENPQRARESLAAIDALPYTHLLPGHGSPIKREARRA